MVKLKKESKNLKNVEQLAQFIRENELLERTPEIKKKSKKLLIKLYQNLYGPYKDELNALKKKGTLEESVKPPLLVSFHPKLSLLNNNVTESLLAVELAKATGCIPLWIPYVYDTATHSLSEGGKIRAPTYSFIESNFIPLRTASQIHGNIIKTEKRVRPKEINKFMNNLTRHLTETLGNLKRHLNPYNFGHQLFDLKKRVMRLHKKRLRKLLKPLEKTLKNARGNTNNMGEFLGKVSLSMLHELGIEMNMAFIEHVIADLVRVVFGEICKLKKVQKNPALLEGLFVHYDIKEKDRTDIQFTGTEFLAYDASANKKFQGGVDELAEGIDQDYILPTGPSLILLFIALGAKYTLGGLHTREYYPEYINNAKILLEPTGFNDDFQVLGYGKVRSLEIRNFTDIMAASRILEKIGSRTVVRRGNISLPKDVVDQINFLAGKETVPVEYNKILEKILEKQRKKRDPAYIREEARYEKFKRLNEIPTEELPDHVDEIQKYYKQTNLKEAHPERIKIAVESLYEDSVMRVEKLRENIYLDQHLLGGTIHRKKQDEGDGQEKEENEDSQYGGYYSGFGDDGDGGYEGDETGEESGRKIMLFGGMLLRSKRVPALMEMYFYGTDIQNDFINPVRLEPSHTPHFPFIIQPNFDHHNLKNEEPIIGMIPNEELTETGDILTFSEYKRVFECLIPPTYLPEFFKEN